MLGWGIWTQILLGVWNLNKPIFKDSNARGAWAVEALNWPTHRPSVYIISNMAEEFNVPITEPGSARVEVSAIFLFSSQFNAICDFKLIRITELIFSSCLLPPLTPLSKQDRFSPNSIKKNSGENKGKSRRWFNTKSSPNWYHKNCHRKQNCLQNFKSETDSV